MKNQKSNNSAVETAPQPVEEVAPPEETSAQAAPRPDPTLFGVAIPLNLTIAALKEVTSAWGLCLTTLRGALMTRLQKSNATPAVTSAPEAVAPVS